METRQAVVHVTSEAGGQWAVAEDGLEGRDVYGTREAAVEAGKKLAQARGPSRLQIHDERGGVAFEQTFDKDPLVRDLEQYGF